jgi:tetratricopeptide (TPR) repeat protein
LPAAAQTAGKLYVRPEGELYFPLDTYQGSSLYSSVGYGAGSALEFSLTPWLEPFVRGQYVSIPYAGGAALQSAEGDLGLGLVARPTDRLSFRLDGMGGFAELVSSGGSGAAYAAGARLGVEYRMSPSFTLSANGGYSTYFGTEALILSAIEAGLYFSYDLSAIGGSKPRLSVEDVKLDAVFPSLYAYYDDNAFGTVKVVNREDASVRDVKVSFNAGRFMDQPKVCGQYENIPKGGSVTVPVTALFTDSVLNITQGSDAKGEIIVEYSYLGSDRIVRSPIDFRMHHRNAITWSDDRRAAAFVSPTNPAAMWFSKYASGIVRDRLRGDINRPLQYAIGMFEAERLYGLNYVVVPANDYSVKHGLKDYIDSVQFPHQTLANRGGDCSDLAILFATLMQSVGIEAAFITIPGHIFAAFDTGLDETATRASFYDQGLLIFRDGKAWIPIEITMVNDGFIKAWRVAAKEWADNSRAGAAAFYRLPDCWKVYPSAAFPDVNPRFSLPDESETAMAFDNALDRFVAREIDPELRSLEAELAKEAPEIRENEIGILYANYGMLKESWKRLSDSAKAGYQKAWTNLGNLAYIRKDFKLALSYYQWSHQIDCADDNALLGIARCQYELEDFDGSDTAYSELRARDPKLAGKFGYLASIFGGEGRAWSLAERFASTSWDSSRVAAAPAATVPSGPSPIIAAASPSPTDAPAPSAAATAPSAPAVAVRPTPIAEPIAATVAIATIPAAADAQVPAIPAPPATPAIAAELPTDTDFENKAADFADAKEAVAQAPAPIAKASPVSTSAAPPAIAELPTDQDLSQKAAQAVAQKAADAEARKPTPVAVQLAAIANAPSPPPEKPAAVQPASAPMPTITPIPEPAETPHLAPPQAAPRVAEVAPKAADAAPAAPAGESGLSASSGKDLLIQGFKSTTPVVGSWVVEDDTAKQTDPDAFYAKLEAPLVQDKRLFGYSFTAKSDARGRGWVGLGLHVFTPKSYTLKGYGSGDSLCIWLTRDPVHFKENVTRLQLYRSTDDWNMDLVDEVPVSESIYDANRFEIRVDPFEGTVSVSMNGTERLVAKGIAELRLGVDVLFRALDTAEFSDFKAEVSK